MVLRSPKYQTKPLKVQESRPSKPSFRGLLHPETLPLASPEFIGQRSQRSNGFPVRDFAAPLKEQGEQLI